MRNLIDDLVQDLSPVRRLPSFGTRAAMWLAGAAMVVGLVLNVTGIRVDVTENLSHPYYSAETALVVLIAIVCALDALRESVPGQRAYPRWAAVAAFAAWMVLSVGRLFSAVANDGVSALIPDVHLACAVITLSASALAAVPLFLLLKRAAPMDPGWCGALLGLSSSGVATIAVQLYCVHRTPAHIMVWHVLPVIAAVLAGTFVGRKWLSPFPGKRARSLITPE
ncbi:MAG: DUF1109 domain-containing protein [Elusimicrobia bacterium]|nr:DUF1109 domain-containing protein [Elusimicrobiota bacterium]